MSSSARWRPVVKVTDHHVGDWLRYAIANHLGIHPSLCEPQPSRLTKESIPFLKSLFYQPNVTMENAQAVLDMIAVINMYGAIEFWIEP